MNNAKEILQANIEMNDVVAAFQTLSPVAMRVFYESYHQYPTTDSAELVASHFKGIAAYKNQLVLTHTNILPGVHFDSNPGKILIANKPTPIDQSSISAIYDTNPYHFGWSHPCSTQACGSFMAMGLQNTDASSCFAEIHVLDLTPLDYGAQPVSIGNIASVNKSNGQSQPSAVNGVAMTKEHGENGKYIVAGLQANALTLYRSVNAILDREANNNQFNVVGETIQFPISGAGIALITQTDGGIYIVALDNDDKGSDNRSYLYKLTINDSSVTCSEEIAAMSMPVPGLSEAVRYATNGWVLTAMAFQDPVCAAFLTAFASGAQNVNILNTSFRWGKGLEITSPDSIKLYASDRNDLTTSRFSKPIDTEKDFSLVSWSTFRGGPSFLPLNTPMSVGGILVANNQEFFAVMQSDGNLCVYRGFPDNQGTNVWNSQATGSGGQFFTIVQTDGNLVTYYGTHSQQGSALWSTQALSDGGRFFLVMQGDGNLCVYKGTSPSDQGEFVWGWMNS